MTQYWNLNIGMSTTCLGYWILIDGEIKKSVTLLSGFIALHCCLPPTRQRGTVVVPQCWQVGSNNCTNSDHGYKDAICIYLFLFFIIYFGTTVLKALEPSLFTSTLRLYYTMEWYNDLDAEMAGTRPAMV